MPYAKPAAACGSAGSVSPALPRRRWSCGWRTKARDCRTPETCSCRSSRRNRAGPASAWSSAGRSPRRTGAASFSRTATIESGAGPACVFRCWRPSPSSPSRSLWRVSGSDTLIHPPRGIIDSMGDLNEPVLPGRGATDYERYLRTDELLALQKDPADVVHRDEHLFQAVHQSSELWLKLACAELDDDQALVERDRVSAASRLIRRASDVMTLITAQLTMLEHMSPNDYAIVRTALGHGAGFDSPGFRRLHRSAPPLAEAFDRLLARRQLTLIDVYERGY